MRKKLIKLIAFSLCLFTLGNDVVFATGLTNDVDYDGIILDTNIPTDTLIDTPMPIDEDETEVVVEEETTEEVVEAVEEKTEETQE